MRLQTHQTPHTEVRVTEPEPNPSAGAALEAGRTLDRLWMEARFAELSDRMQRLQRRRRTFGKLVRRLALSSIFLAMGGFLGTVIFSFWTGSSRSLIVMVTGQSLVLGLSALVVTLMAGAIGAGVGHLQEEAVRNLARREGLELEA